MSVGSIHQHYAGVAVFTHFLDIPLYPVIVTCLFRWAPQLEAKAA